MGPWTAWSSMGTCNCRNSRDRGKKYRHRFPLQYPEFGGKPCMDEKGKEIPEISQSETENCNPNDIKLICKGRFVLSFSISIFDYMTDSTKIFLYLTLGKEKNALGLWTEWSNCYNDCTKDKMHGFKMRTRVCHYPKECGNAKLMQKQKCPAQCNDNTSRFSELKKT